MKESEINSIITSNMKQVGWAYKIPDPSQAAAITSIKRPFDGFGTIYGKSIYWETKRVIGYKALSFSRIEDHQIENLKKIKNTNPNAMCWLIAALWESRKFLHLYFFDIYAIIAMIDDLEKKSVNQKDFYRYQIEGKCVEVKKRLFDLSNIWEKTIYEYEDNH